MLASITKTCTTCLIPKPLEQYWTLATGAHQKRARCIPCTQMSKQEYRAANKARLNKKSLDYYYANKDHLAIKEKEYNESPNGRFKRFLKEARREKHNVTLTQEEFSVLMKKPCFYCQKPLPKTGRCLDRIDSNKEYTIDNVAPCCHVCNIMKNDSSQTEFFNQIELIFKAYSKRNSE